MKKILISFCICLSWLFVNAAEYNVTISNYDFDTQSDNDVVITDQIGVLLKKNDIVNVSVTGYFSVAVDGVGFAGITDNSEDANYWEELTDFDYSYGTVVESPTAALTLFSITKSFVITTDAVADTKYIVRLRPTGCNGIVKLRPTAEPDPEGETYVAALSSTNFSASLDKANYEASFDFSLGGESLKKYDIIKVTLEGSFSQNVDGIGFMIFDADWNVIVDWTNKPLTASAGNVVKQTYEFIINGVSDDFSSSTYHVNAYVSGYDEETVLQFTKDMLPIKEFSIPYNLYGSDVDDDGTSDGWQGNYSDEFTDAVFATTGDDAWSPKFGERFTVKMKGVADFTGVMQFFMADTRAEVGYWSSYTANNNPTFQVTKGEEFDVEQTFLISSIVSKNTGQDMTQPSFVIECTPSITSSMEGFSDDSHLLALSEYSLTYEPTDFARTFELHYKPYALSWQEGFDEEFPNAFSKATGSESYQPSVGDLFTLTMEGISFCTGTMSIGMIDLRENVDWWASFSSYAQIDIEEGELFSLEYHFYVSDVVAANGSEMSYPNLVFTIRSSDAEDNEESSKILYAMQYDLTYEGNVKDELVILGGSISTIGGFYTADKGVQTMAELGDDAHQVVFCLSTPEEGSYVLMSGTEAKNEIVKSQASETRFAKVKANGYNDFISLKDSDFSATQVPLHIGDFYAFKNESLSAIFQVVTINASTQEVGIRVFENMNVVKVFETSYVDFEGSEDVDNDGVSDRWEANFDEFTPVVDDPSWSPVVGEKFSIRMTGFANFTGYVQLNMCDIREEVQWFEEFANSPERFYVEKNKEFVVARDFVVKSVALNEVPLESPMLKMYCVGIPYSSYADFDKTEKRTLTLSEYEMVYTPYYSKLIATWDSYTGNDSDLDGISDKWSGNAKKFESYTDLSVGDIFSVSMKGFSDFTGTMEFNMVDWGEDGGTWTSVAKKSSGVLSVVEGEPFEFTWNFDVTKVAENGRRLEPVLHYKFSPTTTSKQDGFDNTIDKILSLDEFTIDYVSIEKVIGNKMDTTVRALDTLAMYLPKTDVLVSSYGSAMSYQVSWDDNVRVPITFSGDTLYIAPTVAHIGETVEVSVQGTLDNGKVGTSTISINVARDSIIADPQLALVTVINERVLVVWQKYESDKIDHYNIYRESSVMGEYEKIAEVPYNETSIYEDTKANPMVQPWRYRISATPKDSRYSETALSNAHRTLHLQKAHGLGDEINLIWNKYEGVDYSTYKILRTAVVNNNVVLDTIATIASNINTYTDLNPIEGTKSYCVAIMLPEIIDVNTLLKAESGPFALAVSNIAEAENMGEPTAIDEVGETTAVYAVGHTIYVNNAAGKQVEVYDVKGSKITAVDGEETMAINVRLAGVYFVNVGWKTTYKIIIK